MRVAVGLLKMKAKKLLVIVGFNNRQRKSLLYKCCQKPSQLHEALDKCLELGATVVSIRVVQESGDPWLETKKSSGAA